MSHPESSGRDLLLCSKMLMPAGVSFGQCELGLHSPAQSPSFVLTTVALCPHLPWFEFTCILYSALHTNSVSKPIFSRRVVKKILQIEWSTLTYCA
jgi:hypothetical protein